MLRSVYFVVTTLKENQLILMLYNRVKKLIKLFDTRFKLIVKSSFYLDWLKEANEAQLELNSISKKNNKLCIKLLNLDSYSTQLRKLFFLIYKIM